ncbi:hypothetical protein GPA19_05290 [Azoarcus indigens]|uniref:Uncharacterized protein n=1 Tax=Azoarcus indigens TaxID=29545 RepID=A0A4R6DXS5_9RHOO|nr:hypothetical protein [Azoarcus indigens]NMG64359.1 hypothetical protein [Azoarcus indigens]TDN49188.1 hypothetical protein C7389_11239 [Azoarcus indigens]
MSDDCTVIDGRMFGRIRAALGQVAEDDIAWALNVRPPVGGVQFAQDVIFVICNSGMKNTVAQGIFERCMDALWSGKPVREAFGHKGKAAAIERVWEERADLLAGYNRADDKLAYLESLPWVGPITKYHLAKNFGLPYAKPDVHLQSLADREGCTAQALCERLAGETGLTVSAVDTVLWRACALGVIDSKSGRILQEAAA